MGLSESPPSESPLRQGDSKVEHPSQGLVRMRSEAPTLASDVGNLVQIHQGEHEAVEHGHHLRHRRQAHAPSRLPHGRLTPQLPPPIPRPNPAYTPAPPPT